jgi:hypothetical protein
VRLEREDQPLGSRAERRLAALASGIEEPLEGGATPTRSAYLSLPHERRGIGVAGWLVAIMECAGELPESAA